jgi:hypothetical protein
MAPVISFPTRSLLADILYFGEELESYAMHDRVLIDFSEHGFFSPFEMLFIGAKIKSIQMRPQHPRIDIRGHEKHPYAAHMGFFRMAGLEYGRDVGEAWGSDRYLPITCMHRDQVVSRRVV